MTPFCSQMLAFLSLMASSASSTCKHSTESCAQSALSCRPGQVRARHAVTGMGSIPPSLGAYGRGFVMMAFITEASLPQPAPPVCKWLLGNVASQNNWPILCAH